MTLSESSIFTELMTMLSDQFDDCVLPHVGWESGNNVFCPDLLVYEKGALRKLRDEEPDGWFKGRPRLVVEMVTRRRSLHERQQYVSTYLAYGAGVVVEVGIVDGLMLVHHPENSRPLVVRSHMEWPFVADADHIF